MFTCTYAYYLVSAVFLKNKPLRVNPWIVPCKSVFLLLYFLYYYSTIILAKNSIQQCEGREFNGKNSADKGGKSEQDLPDG